MKKIKKITLYILFSYLFIMGMVFLFRSVFFNRTTTVVEVEKIISLTGWEKPSLRFQFYVYELKYKMIKSENSNVDRIFIGYRNKPNKIGLKKGQKVELTLEPHGPSSFFDFFKINNAKYSYVVTGNWRTIKD
jgi:hypothetical protein